jgi:hypothetical protein
MELGEVDAEKARASGDDPAEHRRVKTTIEDWENEQVCTGCCWIGVNDCSIQFSGFECDRQSINKI